MDRAGYKGLSLLNVRVYMVARLLLIAGGVVGRRTCDQEVASSIHGRARLRNDSGQVVRIQLPRR